MATLVASKVTVTYTGNIEKTDNFATPSVAKTLQRIFKMGGGSGNNQLDLLYTQRVALAAYGTANIDLSGTIEDQYGDVAVFTKVKGVLVVNRSDKLSTVTTAEINISGNWIDSWIGQSVDTILIPIQVGGHVSIFNPRTGLTVTASTADILTITNADSTNAAEADVFVFGIA